MHVGVSRKAGEGSVPVPENSGRQACAWGIRQKTAAGRHALGSLCGKGAQRRGGTKVEKKEPIREKARETRQKLIVTAMEVIADKGYHNVTVDEIAKAAGLSTGIAYRYFKNKKELLLAGLEYTFQNIREITGTQFERLAEFESVEEALGYALDQFYLLHKRYYALHEELESLRHGDKEVKALYQRMTGEAVELLMQNCPEEFRRRENLRERIYSAIGILENFAHFQMESGVSGTAFQTESGMAGAESQMESGAAGAACQTDDTEAGAKVLGDVGVMKRLAIQSVMALFA